MSFNLNKLINYKRPTYEPQPQVQQNVNPILSHVQQPQVYQVQRQTNPILSHVQQQLPPPVQQIPEDKLLEKQQNQINNIIMAQKYSPMNQQVEQYSSAQIQPQPKIVSRVQFVNPLPEQQNTDSESKPEVKPKSEVKPEPEVVEEKLSNIEKAYRKANVRIRYKR